jgi:hypothetical protein
MTATERPSDRAIAQAFWTFTPFGESDVAGPQIVELARTLDAAPADPVVSAECWRSALARAVHICDQEAAEWDSDAVVTDKNYAATCASRIRELAREGK